MVHLRATNHPWLGHRYSLRGTYGSYAKGVICKVKEQLDHMAATASGSDSDSTTVMPAMAFVIAQVAAEVAEGREGGGEGRDERAAEQGLEAMEAVDTGVVKPSNAALDQYDFGHGIRGYQRFCSVEMKDVVTKWWTTRRKLSSGSEASISRRSQEFVETVQRIWKVPDKYDPGVSAGDQPYVYLYHGTRTSSIAQFQTQGILSPWPVAQDFSKEPSFYTTNLLRAAYEHVLHERPGLNRDASTRDTVSILVLKVPSAILHGDSACKDNYYFRPEWFSDQEVERWKKFCKMNWSSRFPPASLPEFDVLSGAISVPERLTSRGPVTEICPLTDPDTGERPHTNCFNVQDVAVLLS